MRRSFAIGQAEVLLRVASRRICSEARNSGFNPSEWVHYIASAPDALCQAPLCEFVGPIHWWDETNIQKKMVSKNIVGFTASVSSSK